VQLDTIPDARLAELLESYRTSRIQAAADIKQYGTAGHDEIRSLFSSASARSTLDALCPAALIYNEVICDDPLTRMAAPRRSSATESRTTELHSEGACMLIRLAAHILQIDHDMPSDPGAAARVRPEVAVEREQISIQWLLPKQLVT
jgi:hypothetical protein